MRAMTAIYCLNIFQSHLLVKALKHGRSDGFVVSNLEAKYLQFNQHWKIQKYQSGTVCFNS